MERNLVITKLTAYIEQNDTENNKLSLHEVANLYGMQDDDFKQALIDSKMENFQNSPVTFTIDDVIQCSFILKSHRALQTRRYLIGIIKDCIIKGFAMDKEKLEYGSIINDSYFENLLENIKEIRVSKRNFCQKATDLYALSFDYNKEDSMTLDLYTNIWKQLHKYAKENALKGNDKTGIRLSNITNFIDHDTQILLNYKVDELIDYAEQQAKNKTLLYMEDWKKKLEDLILYL